MKKIALILTVALLVAACGGPTAKIDVTVANLPDSSVVLQKLNYKRLSVVDTVKTDATGHFAYKVKMTNENPAFYYIFSGETRIAGLVLLPDDNVKVVADGKGKYTIEGSEESLHLKEIDDAFAETVAKMNNILAEGGENMNRDLGQVYIAHKRAMLRQIFTNPHSITSATVLFQKFNDNLPTFSELSDAFIFKAVYDSLKSVYPKSEFIAGLADEINVRTNQQDLAAKLQSVEESGFPEISLPDINGEKKSLSELKGKVIILSFWSVDQKEHLMLNKDLADIYAKYHERGLEIYQVSLDIDKASWASAVKSQQLKWINVNDGLGVQSPAVASYNLQTIPSMFIIGRDGDIAARDVYEPAAIEKEIAKLI